MNHVRRAVALIGSAVLVAALAPGIAQAGERKPTVTPVHTDGPAIRLTNGARYVMSPDGTEARSEFFAGHQIATEDAVENHALFQIHKWECGADDDGVLSSIITYDENGFLNGGPGVFMYCESGEQSYVPVILDWSAGQIPVDGEVAPGDWIQMSATRDGGVATYLIENLTQGWGVETNGTGDYVNAFVETGDAAITLGGTPVGPPAFGRDAVKHVVLNSLALSESGSLKTQMTTADPEVIIERATKHRHILPDERFSLINKT